MLTKHFLKVLIFFTILIGIGLVGVFLVSYLEERKSSGVIESSTDTDRLVPVAR